MSFDPVRLRNLLSLMSSDSDGEALAAARAAVRHVEAAGLTWTDLIVAPPGLTAAPLQTVFGRGGVSFKPPVGRTWSETLTFLCSRRAGRTNAENRLLDRLAADAAARPDVIVVSPRQAQVILDIYRSMIGDSLP
jgi:hypothetical protein